MEIIFNLLNFIVQIVASIVPQQVRDDFWYASRERLRQYFAFRKFVTGSWIRPRRKPIAFGFMVLGVPLGSIGVLLSATVIIGSIYGIIYGIIPVLPGILLALYFGAFGIYSYTFARDTTTDYLRLR
jgi:hypothetical protein